MLNIEYTSQFKKDLKKAKKNNKDILLLDNIVKNIAKNKKLPEKYKDHKLKGKFLDHRELHIDPDWLLIYKIFKKDKKVVLVRASSHSELFE